LKLGSCAALALFVATLAGCTTDQGMLSLAAPYEVSLDARRLDLETLPIVRDVEGSHWAVTSVLFVPLPPGASLADAVADAVARGHGDILTRARVTTTKYWFLVGLERVGVRGNVIDLRATQ
jgi:hypothetical protein